MILLTHTYLNENVISYTWFSYDILFKILFQRVVICVLSFYSYILSSYIIELFARRTRLTNNTKWFHQDMPWNKTSSVNLEKHSYIIYDNGNDISCFAERESSKYINNVLDYFSLVSSWNFNLVLSALWGCGIPPHSTLGLFTNYCILPASTTAP